MTTLMLSQHSSNPLEARSSDPRNQSYLQQYMEAQQRRREDDDMSSDDPLNVYGDPEAADYDAQGTVPHPLTRSNDIVQDFDEEMCSDEEFQVGLPEDMDEYEDEGGGQGDDSDADGETDEELSIQLKTTEEQHEIQEEISDLEETVPKLAEDYKVVDRLGTGTFSSVYKALDLGYHHKWDNNPWHGYHPPASSAHYQSAALPQGSKAFVAIKRIYTTSSPERIRNEIAIMKDCRGCRHVSQLITAFRHHDQVVAIMPFNRNEDFREFFEKLSMEGIKAYFRCMFRALRDIHARGIVHRDVKPANFLFDPRSGIGTLCDFGLACRIGHGPSQGGCLHSRASQENPHGKILKRGEYDVEHVKRMQKDARLKSSWPSDKVGYPDKDPRPHSKANRAGTRGFRAPEVLLKCGDQSGAIDVWSAGMILLFFLTGKFPLFQSSDDVEALMEISTIIGKKRMEKVATLHNRTFATNVPSVPQEGITWRSFVERLNPEIHIPREPDLRFYPHSHKNSESKSKYHPPHCSSSTLQGFPSGSASPASSQPPTAEQHATDLEAVFDLVERLLRPESTERITPRQALYHSFLADPAQPADDEYFPHPFGEGVCGEWHFVDEVTEEPCVKVNLGDGKSEVIRLLAGEGIAIGARPCEFHQFDFGC